LYYKLRSRKDTPLKEKIIELDDTSSAKEGDDEKKDVEDLDENPDLEEKPDFEDDSSEGFSDSDKAVDKVNATSPDLSEGEIKETNATELKSRDEDAVVIGSIQKSKFRVTDGLNIPLKDGENLFEFEGKSYVVSVEEKGMLEKQRSRLPLESFRQMLVDSELEEIEHSGRKLSGSRVKTSESRKKLRESHGRSSIAIEKSTSSEKTAEKTSEKTGEKSGSHDKTHRQRSRKDLIENVMKTPPGDNSKVRFEEQTREPQAGKVEVRKSNRGSLTKVHGSSKPSEGSKLSDSRGNQRDPRRSSSGKDSKDKDNKDKDKRKKL